MSAITDFYRYYLQVRIKYNLSMVYKTNEKETKITIYENKGDRKELVKIVDENREYSFIRAKRELEEKLKKRCEKCKDETDLKKSPTMPIKERLQKLGWEIT